MPTSRTQRIPRPRPRRRLASAAGALCGALTVAGALTGCTPGSATESTLSSTGPTATATSSTSSASSAPTSSTTPTPTVTSSTLPTTTPAVEGDRMLSGYALTQALGDARVKLAALPLAPEAGAEQYARTLFGQTWADVDGNGCSTRNDVLARDLTNVKTAADGCAVTYGVLADPYSGLTVQFQRGQETSRLVPIDHRVPLAEAWASGASGWTEDERLHFANDLANLVATTEGENSGKSDQDPAEWLPSWRGGWCTYTVAYIDVKITWRLSVDQAEFDALNRLLATC